MPAPGRFGAVVCAMATPFNADGSLDLPGAVTLAKWLVDNGNDGLVVAGTTGEATTLTDAEKVALWEAVRAAVSVPVLAGTGTPSTAHTVELTKAAAGAGADGVLVVVPYYNRPSQAGIEAHFRAVADATSLPVVLYDIPKRTGREVKTSTLVTLATHGVISAVKDAAGSVSATAALVKEAPSGFEVYSGEDALTLALVAVGAVGVISVASHWAGPQMSEMIACYAKGDTEAAMALNERLIESWEFQGSDAAPNPVPTKAMLRTLGLPAGECRLPMGPTPAGLEEKAKQVWANLHNWSGAAPQAAAKVTAAEASPVRIAFLGGLGEIGRNCAWFEMDGEAVLVDCGLMFPDTEMPGVDLVLPDFTYIMENSERLVGCVLTHAHEDHCGALSYLLRDVSFPIYGSELSLGLARNRIDEAGLADRAELISVQDGEIRKIGPFDVEFVPVAHSVPHGFTLAFHTPQGVILHTGDFKLDLTPVDGRRTDLTRIGALAAGEGIRLLLSDSTNAEEDGRAPLDARGRQGAG